MQLEKTETTKLNHINANYINNTYSRLRSQSLTEVDSFEGNEILKTPPRRDFGAMCSVLTRNIGVGHQNPNTKSVSTITHAYDEPYSDRWLNKKYTFLNGNECEIKKPTTISKSIQTSLTKSLKQKHTQTTTKEFIDKITQIAEIKKRYENIGINVQPNYSNKAVQNSIELASIGSSNHSINDEYCTKCNTHKKTIGVGPENNTEPHLAPVSLASLSTRSKSFNLGEERLHFASKNRSIAIQYESTSINKASQSESNSISKSSQHEIKYSNKSTQYDIIEVISKTTDTKDLQPTKKSIGCEAKDMKITFEVGCNTIISPEKVAVCAKCTTKEKNEILRKDRDETPSRIPRLHMPTTPTENRKFKRQDTYTKIPAVIPAP